MAKVKVSGPHADALAAAVKKGKCKLVVCEDPDTGMVKLAPSGECDPGWIKKVKECIETKGILWSDKPMKPVD